MFDRILLCFFLHQTQMQCVKYAAIASEFWKPQRNSLAIPFTAFFEGAIIFQAVCVPGIFGTEDKSTNQNKLFFSISSCGLNNSSLKKEIWEWKG